jgi:hypothetical protein
MNDGHLHEVRDILKSLDMDKVDLFQVAQLMNQMMNIEKAQFRIMRIKNMMEQDGAICAEKFFKLNN